MSHDVFISYARQDHAIAIAIGAGLEAAGIRFWITPLEDVQDPNARKTKARAIRQSRAVILVLTPDSNASPEITQELQLAAESKRLIIPVRMGEVIPEPGKQFYLGRTHWLEATHPLSSEQMQRLVERVQAAQTKEGSEHQLGSVSPQAGRGLGVSWVHFVPSVFIVLGAIVALVLAVASAQIILNRLAAPTPVAAVAAFTPVPSSTPSPTLTIVPTPSAAEQARAFAAPILAAISQRLPTIQDDFSNSSSGWKGFGGPQPGGTMNYADGKLSVVSPPFPAPGSASANMPPCYAGSAPNVAQFQNLVLEADVNPLSSAADAQLQFRVSANGGYALVLKRGNDETLSLLHNEGPQNLPLLEVSMKSLGKPAEGDRVLVVAQGPRIAIFANGEPLALITDPKPLPIGMVSIAVCNMSDQPAEARFDNLKIWDISDLAY